jgi:hypothetical protein
MRVIEWAGYVLAATPGACRSNQRAITAQCSAPPSDAAKRPFPVQGQRSDGALEVRELAASGIDAPAAAHVPDPSEFLK